MISQECRGGNVEGRSRDSSNGDQLKTMKKEERGRKKRTFLGGERGGESPEVGLTNNSQ